jgi:hypothetical protein
MHLVFIDFFLFYNKKLFLARNSRFDYTDLLRKYAFGDDWKNLFHLIIVDCQISHKDPYSVPPAMTTDAVNYPHDANFKMFQVSETKTYPNIANLYFLMRKEFQTKYRTSNVTSRQIEEDRFFFSQ